MGVSDILNKFRMFLATWSRLPQRIELIQQSLGRIEARQLALTSANEIQSHEFKVSSQWGEDGIIQFLLRKIDIPNPVFVEFGIGDYHESNTRFLLKNNNWSGLVIDGSARNIQRLSMDQLFWQQDIKAECAFITKDNINELISKNGITGDIGILSVDIDGNDYWIWEAITCISPRIVICEYNSLFGSKLNVTTPYKPDFQIFNAHYSGLYWGASIGAFDHLARAKGYTMVGSNSAGNNVFFVRNDVIGDLPKLTPAEAHVVSKFRISRDQKGNLTFVEPAAGLDLIKALPLVDVTTMETVSAAVLAT